MLPEDLVHLRQCGPPAVHPDGSLALTSMLRPDLDTDEYTGGLWQVRLDGSEPPRPLTRGHRDTAPAVSPDGRWAAFLRSEPRGQPQLHVVELGGGEPVRLTDHPLGSGPPRWSPDSRRIAYTAMVPEPGRYGTQEGLEPQAEPPRLITRLAYRTDGLGYVRDRLPHVFVVDMPDLTDVSTAVRAVCQARQVTEGDASDADVAWTGDGRELLFTSDRHETADRDLRRGVYAVPADGGEPRLLVGGDLAASHPEPGADGDSVVFVATDVGSTGLEFVARHRGLYRAPLDGSGEATRLTDAETVNLDDTDRLTVTPRGVLVLAAHRGAVRLLAVPEGGGEPRVLLGGEQQVRSAAATPDGDVAVAVVSDPHSPGDLCRVSAGEAERLTDVGATLRQRGLVRPRELTVPADDGYPVHGWVVLPDPERYGQGPHPVLLDIHGGPFAQYGWGLFDEAQVYAAAGYAVLLPNPRGSAGYGQAHGAAIAGAMGGRDADDVLQFLDGALAKDALALDRARVGVMGGSYGGYMAALLTTRTDRFVAAVVERGYLDAASFVGSADIGWFFPAGYHGSREAMAEQSPMRHADRVRTPTLVIHSEADWRTPVEQGQRWYTALKLAGVEAELLLFPGEGHELTRSGRPRHRVARFEHILRWWGRHLPVEP